MLDRLIFFLAGVLTAVVAIYALIEVAVLSPQGLVLSEQLPVCFYVGSSRIGCLRVEEKGAAGRQAPAAARKPASGAGAERPSSNP
jgi:hypothetical protein